MSWHDIIAMVTPTLAVIVSAIFGQIMRNKSKTEFHLILNSRLTQLLEITRLQAYAEGQIQGAKDTHEVIKNHKSTPEKRKKEIDSFDTIA